MPRTNPTGSSPARNSGGDDASVAEWVLGMKGQVKIVLADGKEEKNIAQLADLPEATYAVTEIDLRKTSLIDGDLARLKNLSRLHKLNLGATGITSEGMQHVGRVRSLEELHLSHTNISNDDLKHLSHLSNLRRLGLFHCKRLNNYAWRYLNLRVLPALRYIDIAETEIYAGTAKTKGVIHRDCKINESSGIK